MIQANELRIGNLVRFHDSIPISVGSIGKENIFNDGQWIPVELLFYVELTPEILEACGFEQEVIEGETVYSAVLDRGTTMLDGDGFFFIKPPSPDQSFFSFEIIDVYGKSSGAYVEIKHLHQLQNIYFALTGEELKINMNVTA